MAGVLGVLAVAGANILLILWAVAVGGIAGAALAWSRAAWREVDVSVRFTPERVFHGEPITLTVRIENGKKLPLPMIRLHVWLPPGLVPRDGSGPAPVRGFRRRLSMGGHSEAVIELPARALTRGEYRLERIEMELSDPFGLTPLVRELKPETDLLVMPEARITIPLEIRRRLPFGVPARALRMFEERERFAGVRPYEPGDPLNRIHWRLTGHAGVLQTKLFEPTRTADVFLIMDLSVGEPFWDAIFPEIAEDTIGWASFLARQAIDNGWRVGLMANTHLTRGRGPLRVPAGHAGGHEAALFAALSRMPNEPTSDLGPVLRESTRRMWRGTTAVVISPRPGPRLRHEIAIMRRRGIEVVELSPLEAAWQDSRI